jgi:uncharacterized membrane protein YhaH (DUF805 family)
VSDPDLGPFTVPLLYFFRTSIEGLCGVEPGFQEPWRTGTFKKRKKIVDWYLLALKKYLVFEGRARRKEYWYFVLFNILAGITLGIIDNVTGTLNPETGMGLLSGLYSLAVLIPTIAVSIRRLHDTDRSGWWLLIALIPLIGGLVLLVFFVLDGTPGTNQYGPNPKEETAGDQAG